MKSLSDLEYVKGLQGSLRTLPIHDKDIMAFLENLCGWYDFQETDPNLILIAHGKRQVLATIKTLMESTPEQIVALTKE